jgi:hypothetical protein
MKRRITISHLALTVRVTEKFFGGRKGKGARIIAARSPDAPCNGATVS